MLAPRAPAVLVGEGSGLGLMSLVSFPFLPMDFNLLASLHFPLMAACPFQQLLSSSPVPPKLCPGPRMPFPPSLMLLALTWGIQSCAWHTEVSLCTDQVPSLSTTTQMLPRIYGMLLVPAILSVSHMLSLSPEQGSHKPLLWCLTPLGFCSGWRLEGRQTSLLLLSATSL